MTQEKIKDGVVKLHLALEGGALKLYAPGDGGRRWMLSNQQAVQEIIRRVETTAKPKRAEDLLPLGRWIKQQLEKSFGREFDFELECIDRHHEQNGVTVTRSVKT